MDRTVAGPHGVYCRPAAIAHHGVRRSAPAAPVRMSRPVRILATSVDVRARMQRHGGRRNRSADPRAAFVGEPARRQRANRFGWNSGCGFSRHARAATCCSSPERRRRSAWTAAFTRSPKDRSTEMEIEGAVVPALPPHARRDVPRCAHRRRVVQDRRASAASGSTCTASAGGRRPPCGCCRRACRALPRSGLPAAVKLLTRLPRGLVLVGGPTGSGKSTTLAAIVDEINRRDARHIVTIEDPIEYEHLHHRSVVEQVEIGVDAPDFPTALRAALRQAPDIIVVGEMRDPETMQIALAAGGDGAPRAVDASYDRRRVDCFEDRRFVSRWSGRILCGRSWRWRWRRSMTQTLLPRIGGGMSRPLSC